MVLGQLRQLPQRLWLWARQLPRRLWSWLRRLPRRLVTAVWLWATTPEKKRVDRDRMYIWCHVGLLAVGLGIGLRPEGAGVLAALGADELRVLALLMMLGSIFCLVGTCVPAHEGVDIRTPYLMAAAGLLQVVVSLAFYSLQIAAYSDLIGTLGGGLSITIGCACIHITLVALKEYWRIGRLV